MCRHIGYLGLPVMLAELVLDPPHSLAVQSYAPRDMRGGGTVNVDGFGVGWFAAEPEPRLGSEPAAGSAGEPPGGRPVEGARRYRRPVPIWQDAPFADLARQTAAVGMLAAVRNATAGMPVAEAACAPFTDGHWLFSLNGLIAGWPDTAIGLVEEIPRRELLSMQVMTDATLLWALLRQRLAASADPASALGDLVIEVLAAAPGSRLTTLLTDGRQLYATTVTHSLWSRHSAAGVLLASEPLDEDSAWQPIPDGQLVVADRSGVRHRPLRHEVPVYTESESHVHQR
ncbi:MAG: gamma-glutamyl hercynylcysteine S-oxide hydrolase [Pseudonocardiales bacterium]|jgi:glutamine amidotransferase|nr:gamma-glutamyl hercynylcysteine S-oxide hydrolase [Pseudonocardiales bacterium]